MSLRKKIVFISILPVILLGILSLVLTMTVVKNSMVSEVQMALKGTAAATLAAYDQNSGDYQLMENGDLWKGSYNVSKSENLIDRIKENSGMEVTFFYGKQRIMTSAFDENGNRILGSPAGDKIAQTVLEGGEEYFSKAVSIDGVLHYGYYMPVRQNGDENGAPIGMVFVGANKAEKDGAINKILSLIGIAVGGVMLICTACALQLSGGISRRLKDSISVVRTVSKGELNVEIGTKLTKRRDEIGKLSRAMVTLRDELKTTMADIAKNAQALSGAAEVMGNAAGHANGSMRQMRHEVAHITESAAQQAAHARNTTNHMALMGDTIVETTAGVDALNQNAAVMKNSSTQASATIQQLQDINSRVDTAISAVQEQTVRTNESVQKIMDASRFITSIAEETNLLSLNARVEAARAGETGRGFAVVANQIRDLADQSNKTSKDIEEITATLMENSGKAVEIMQQMQGILAQQRQSMQDTSTVVGEVMQGIDSSLGSIDQIKESTRRLDASRTEVVSAVNDLNEIAQANAASTHKTDNATGLVARTLENVSNSADDLRKIAEELVESIRYFHL